MDIKPLLELDATRLKFLISGYVSDAKYVVSHAETDEETGFTLRLVRLDTPYVKRYDPLNDATLRRYSEALQHGFSFGAYADDLLIGLALAEPQLWNHTLCVWELHIAEPYRGQGVGSQLMAVLVEKGTTAGLRAIVCETQTTNMPAIRFYRKMGFHLEGVDLSYYTNQDYPDGEIAVFMKKRLIVG